METATIASSARMVLSGDVPSDGGQRARLAHRVGTTTKTQTIAQRDSLSKQICFLKK